MVCFFLAKLWLAWLAWNGNIASFERLACWI
jgi:hypothetical protein